MQHHVLLRSTVQGFRKPCPLLQHCEAFSLPSLDDTVHAWCSYGGEQSPCINGMDVGSARDAGGSSASIISLSSVTAGLGHPFIILPSAAACRPREGAQFLRRHKAAGLGHPFILPSGRGNIRMERPRGGAAWSGPEGYAAGHNAARDRKTYC